MKRVSLCAAILAVCCGWTVAETHGIAPGQTAVEELQTALILAAPGDVVVLAEGRYDVWGGLSLDIDRVTIRGAGMDKTVLSFANQDMGSEGLLVTSDGVVLEDFAIEDSKGDAIKTKGNQGITIRRVRAEWTGGPKETNGAYGFYPVEARDVLLDGCVAIGASDAGIYVGQSENIIVRGCRAEYNVAGIEIENCWGADVYENVATHNTGGILVFDLPGLPKQDGRNVRVFNNEILNNDTPNFAPAGNIVGTVSRGTGLSIMANRNVEVFGNTIRDNQSANIFLNSYQATLRPIRDPDYDPYVAGIHIHDNVIENGGADPQELIKATIAPKVGVPLPDIIWDGIVNESIMVGGVLPPDRRIYIRNNGDADFINLDLLNLLRDAATARVSRDITAHDGELPSLEPIVIAGVE